MDQLGIKHKLSTAYHPQTDGQTERLNQTIEAYLRCFCNYKQNNWVSLLPTAQLAYNSARNETTQLSPFYANYGYEAETMRTPLLATTIAEDAKTNVEDLRDLYKCLWLDIIWMQRRMAKYYNNRRIAGLILKKGDKVYLLRHNIKTTRPSNKLDYTKLRPFRILKKKGLVNYKLDLPKEMRIMRTFHIGLLEPADPDTPIQTHPPKIDPESQVLEYEVERVVEE